MTSHIAHIPTLSRLATLAAVALGYGLLAHLSMLFRLPDGTPLLWAPAGFALAALLLGGLRLWPGVLAGALIAATGHDVGAFAIVGIGFSAALEALLGAALIARLDFRPRLGRVRDIAILAGAGCVAAAGIGAGLVAVALAATDPEPLARVLESWGRLWLAASVGVIVVAPVVLVLADVRDRQRRRPTAVDAGVGLALLTSAALSINAVVPPYMVFPALLLTAMRFRATGAAMGGLVVSLSAAWAVAHGFGGFSMGSASEVALSSQSFIVMATMTALMLGAMTGERLDAHERLLDSEAERVLMGVERQAEQRFRRSFDDAPIGMAILGFHGHLLRVNHALVDITGYAEADLIGRTVDEISHPADVGAEAGHLESLLSGSVRTYEVEKRLIRRDGTLAWVLVSGSMVRDEAHRPAYLIAHFVDMSERRQAESELVRSTDELRRSNEELERFAYIASHDLAEPLRTMSGFASLLRDRYAGVLDQRGLRYADHVVGAAERMRELIDDLLEYSRAGRRQPAREPVDTDRLAREVVAELGARVEDRRATVHFGDLPIVAGDPVLLRQLLQNLIANALKFTGDRPPEVRVCGESTPTAWRISVTDNGIGIDPRHSDRIFEMFQRLHTREEFEGTGIGLALTKRIVELHGGSIGVRSEPGAGTTFTFTLPVAPVRHALTAA